MIILALVSMTGAAAAQSRAPGESPLGRFVRNPGQLGAGALTVTRNNAASGTAPGLLVMPSGNNAVATAGVAATNASGICLGGCGSGGTATIAIGGTAQCVFDGATTAGDWVVPSSTTAGQCHDAGSTFPTGAKVMGQVNATNGAAGTYALTLAPAGVNSASFGTTQAAKTSNYTAVPSDANTIIPVSCASATCLVTLPAGSAYSPGAAIKIVNESNATAIPIKAVGGSGSAWSCSGTSCTSSTATFTVTNTGDFIAIWILACNDSGCSTNGTQTITSVSDGGDTCAVVPGASGWGGGYLSAIAYCKNTGSTGSKTLTLTASATIWNLSAWDQEFSGVATGTVVDAGTPNFGTGTSATPNVTLAGPTSAKTDLILASLNGNGLNTIAPRFSTVGVTTNEASEYYLANGAVSFTMDFGASASAPWGEAVAAILPAAGPSNVVVCAPTSGATLYGTPTATNLGCAGNTAGVPLVPGASAEITVDASNNDLVTLHVPVAGITDITAASYTPTLLDCYETLGLLDNLAAQTITIPQGLPQGCTLNLIQAGTQAAGITHGAGLTLFGNGHTNGQYTPSTVQIGGGGGIGYFVGNTAP